MMGQDIEQMADLGQVRFSESWSENLIRMNLDSRLNTYFVYTDHGTTLGYTVLWILADKGGIRRIGVYPHYRRQGIVRRLTDATVTLARARGVRTITPKIRGSSLGARSLYDSYDSRQEAMGKGYYYGPAEDVTIMWNRAM